MGASERGLSAGAKVVGRWIRHERLAAGIGVLLSCLVCVGIPSGRAQTGTTGALSGMLRDASGAVLPGVDVAVTNEATGESRSVVTDERGSYMVPLLAPGKYRIDATLSGFKTAMRSDIQINITERAAVDIRLEVGQLNESVTVAAAIPQLMRRPQPSARSTRRRSIRASGRWR